MVEYCASLNFFQNRTITDTFDKYVILVFFLVLLFTIVIVVIVVKYVTYNLQQDREREQQILERRHKPTRIEEILEDSDDEYVWSDDEQDEQLPDMKDVDVVDNETISLCSNLNTNYVDRFLVESSGNEEEDDDKNLNDLNCLLMKLNLDNEVENNSPCQVLTRVYVSDDNKELPNSPYTFTLLSFYNSCIFKIAAFRKTAFSQTVDFAIEFLCSLHVLPEIKALSLKTKYEQRLEKLSYNIQKHTNIHAILNQGKELLSISQNFAEDIDDIVKNKEIVSQISSCLQSEPLDMLKVYVSSLTHLHEFCKDNCISTINGIKICEKLLFTIKTRYHCFRENIAKENSSTMFPEALSEFESNINAVCKNFQTHFIDALYKIKQLNLSTLNAEKQTILKFEEDIGLAKLDIINSKADNFQEKLKKFNDMMIAFIISHFEEINQNQLTSMQQQNGIIKNIFSGIQKHTFSQINEVEETLLISLKEKCNIADKSMFSIVQNVQDSLKSSVLMYQQFIDKCETSSLEVLNKGSKLVHLFIEHIIKAVSVRFKTYLPANTSAAKSWPSVKEQSTDKIVLGIRGKLSAQAFDVVCALMHKFFTDMSSNQTFSVFTVPKVNVYCLHEDILGTKILPDVHNSTFLCDANQLSQLPSFEQFLDSSIKEYNQIIIKSFDEITSNLQKEVKEKIIKSVDSVFFENILIYSNVKKQLSRPESSKTTDKKSSKYLSRKRSSFKEKNHHAKLLELYQGLLNVKEHKYHEQCKQNLLELHRKSPVKSGANFVVKYLNKQLNHLQMSQTKTKVDALYMLQHYYMKEMFLKKMKQLEEDIEGSRQKDNFKDESPQLKQKPSRSTLRNSARDNSSLSKKISFLPKKRKSRKVADETNV